MRILHLYKDYPPIQGGIENHLRVVARNQAMAGHTVTVLVTNPAGRQTVIREEEGVRVIRAGRLATVASTPLSLAWPGYLAREGPDITHLHFPYPFGDVMHSLWGHSRRTVITYHSDIVRQKALLRVYAPWLRRSLRRADCIIASAPAYVTSSPFLAPLAEHCSIAPYGIPLARFMAPDPARVTAIRQRFSGPLLLFVGQLRYYKGVDYLIRALPHTSGRALIVGREKTVRRTDLSALASSLGVLDRVHFLDVEDADLPAYYQASDLFVLPSVERSEAFGIVLIEALAAGLPAVCTELGTGTSYVNQDGITGRVVPPRDAEALASAITELLADPARRSTMAAAARCRAAAEFSEERMMSRIMQIYDKVMAG